jgi:hypothetical protein
VLVLLTTSLLRVVAVVVMELALAQEVLVLEGLELEVRYL